MSSLHGLIDIHCHLLPGIDDGCQNLKETLHCVSLLQNAGFAGSICTPHVGTERYAHNVEPFISEQTALLQATLVEQGIDYSLWSGGELRLPPDRNKTVSAQSAIKLAGSNHVLFDWWGKQWPAFLDDYFAELFEEGMQPVLAHPERLPFEEQLFWQTMDQLLADGVLLQGNLKSFSNASDQRVRQRAEELLMRDQYFFIASDAHGPRSIPSRIDGLNELKKRTQPQQLLRLMSENPKQLIGAESNHES